MVDGAFSLLGFSLLIYFIAMKHKNHEKLFSYKSVVKFFANLRIQYVDQLLAVH